MARWQLMEKHYLNVPGTEWEYKETTDNGRQARKVLAVPLYLDPESPADCNYPGMIVVSNGKGEPRDIVFVGSPTPDMRPMDDEAEAISAETKGSWTQPLDTLANDSSSGAAFASMAQMLASHNATQTPKSAISVDDFAILQAQVASLMARNAELEAGNRRSV